MKKVAGTLKITLAQYRAQAAFAMFASDLDAATQRQLTRGARLMELLKQPQYTPYSIEHQVASVWVGTKGYLDTVPLEKVHEFESQFLAYLEQNTSVLSDLRESGQLSAQMEENLTAAADEFAKSFQAAYVPETDLTEPEAVAAQKTQEQIVRKKRG
ncbi:hypothetical protein [Arcanobacterium hippocoleae]|uniref:hypothetical protein n=1 Tax=Arcanobacterium hippocoleae TaxID=149017 RepID=UPI00333FCDEE